MNQLTKVQEIKQAIMFGNFTSADIEILADAVKYARTNLARQNARSFWNGDKVKFRDNKRGITHSGNVVKIKLKYALVRTTSGLQYNVPLSLLESAE